MLLAIADAPLKHECRYTIYNLHNLQMKSVRLHIRLVVRIRFDAYIYDPFRPNTTGGAVSEYPKPRKQTNFLLCVYKSYVKCILLLDTVPDSFNRSAGLNNGSVFLNCFYCLPPLGPSRLNFESFELNLTPYWLILAPHWLNLVAYSLNFAPSWLNLGPTRPNLALYWSILAPS